MDASQTIARWEADERDIRARLSDADAGSHGGIAGRSGMAVLEAIFAGELPPAVGCGVAVPLGV